MKKLLSLIGIVFSQILDQLWTLVALVIGWLVLEGSAKTTTANLVIAATIIWIITYRVRNPKE